MPQQQQQQQQQYLMQQQALQQRQMMQQQMYQQYVCVHDGGVRAIPICCTILSVCFDTVLSTTISTPPRRHMYQTATQNPAQMAMLQQQQQQQQMYGNMPVAATTMPVQPPAAKPTGSGEYQAADGDDYDDDEHDQYDASGVKTGKRRRGRPPLSSVAGQHAQLQREERDAIAAAQLHAEINATARPRRAAADAANMVLKVVW